MRRKFLFLLVAVVVLVTGSHVEARLRRWRARMDCVVQPTPPHPGPSFTTYTCPLYVWMRYGSYCSYFAVHYKGCDAFSYDSTNCGLASIGCDSDNNDTPTAADSGCIPIEMLDVSHPGYAGYSFQNRLPLATRIADGSPLPGGDTSQLTVNRLKSLVIKFNDINRSDVSYYAQVYIAEVELVQASPGACKTAKLVRGLQIAPVSDNQVDLVLTPGATGATRINPLGAHDHAYVLTTEFEGKTYQIPVIMHYSALPHGR